MRTEDRDKAIELKQANVPVTEIAKQLNVSKSSVYNWTRNIEIEEKALTPLAVSRHNTETVTQDKWFDKKEMTQEQMISQYKSWAFICARLNGESVATQKLRLYARTSPNQKRIKNFTTKEVDNRTFSKIIKAIPNTKPVDVIEEVYDHPVLDLIYKVNSNSNYFDNMQLTQTYMDLTGNAYWYIVFDRDGMPAELYQMRPDFTSVVSGKTELIKGYIYGNTNKSALKTDEVVRFYVPNPSNPYYGKSCIEAASAEVSRNNLYNVYENSALMNNGRPDFIVKYEGNLTAEDQKRMTIEWNRLYQGTQNAGKIKVMDNNFNVTPLSFKPEEMQYLEGRHVTKKDLASMFGIPFSLLDSENQLKAGIQDIQVSYQRYGILPRLKRIEDTLNEQLINRYYDDSGDLFFMFDDCVSIDKKENSDIFTKYVNAGVLSVNEVRAELGYDSVEGGDDLKASQQSNPTV